MNQNDLSKANELLEQLDNIRAGVGNIPADIDGVSKYQDGAPRITVAVEFPCQNEDCICGGTSRIEVAAPADEAAIYLDLIRRFALVEERNIIRQLQDMGVELDDERSVELLASRPADVVLQ